jgi:hypothetical protein
MPGQKHGGKSGKTRIIKRRSSKSQAKRNDGNSRRLFGLSAIKVRQMEILW